MARQQRTWITGTTKDERILIDHVEIVSKSDYKEETDLPEGITVIIPKELPKGKIILYYCVKVFRGRDLFKDSSFSFKYNLT